MLTNSTTRYGSVSRTLHWLAAALIITLVIVGLYMSGLDDNDPNRLGIYSLHKSFGILVALLLVARVLWLGLSPAPALPSVFSTTERRLTKGLQSLLYLLMALVPVGGYVMSMAGGHPVSFFGLFDLPVLLEKNKAVGGFAHEGHELMAFAIIALVLIHVAGALKHRFMNPGGEADVLKRML